MRMDWEMKTLWRAGRRAGVRGDSWPEWLSRPKSRVITRWLMIKSRISRRRTSRMFSPIFHQSEHRVVHRHTHTHGRVSRKGGDIFCSFYLMPRDTRPQSVGEGYSSQAGQRREREKEKKQHTHTHGTVCRREADEEESLEEKLRALREPVAKVVKNGAKTTRERDESAWESGERWKRVRERERESCLLNVDQQAWRGWWDHRSVQSLVSHSPSSSSHFLKCHFLSKSSSANLWSMALHPLYPSPATTTTKGVYFNSHSIGPSQRPTNSRATGSDPPSKTQPLATRSVAGAGLDSGGAANRAPSLPRAVSLFLFFLFTI